jgi:putative transposase
VNPGEALAVVRQCVLAEVCRATVYAHRKPRLESPEDLELLRLIDEEYTRRPFFGSRRMVLQLRDRGYAVNRKRVQRLMQTLGLAGMAPGPHTSRPQPGHRVYPYLLRGVEVVRPNQVWSSDITYIRLARGFVYLVAVMDWYSRKVLSWRLSNSLETAFCVEALEDALARYGLPEVFNTDQGTQFTSTAFTQVLKAQDIRISMDGRGRAADNIFVERLWRTVKYEDIYLKEYREVSELLLGLAAYFEFYNRERRHQSLGYRTPAVVYTLGQGGGAKIIDKFRGTAEESAGVPATPATGPVYRETGQQPLCCERQG